MTTREIEITSAHERLIEELVAYSGAPDAPRLPLLRVQFFDPRDQQG